MTVTARSRGWKGPRRRPLFTIVSSLLVCSCIATAGCEGGGGTELELRWEGVPDRPWPGPDLWANRVQDWEVRDGRLTATGSLPMRTAHILTRTLLPATGEARVALRVGWEEAPTQTEEGLGSGEVVPAVGLLLGVGGGDLDYRRTALVHHSPGPGGGVFLGLEAGGRIVIRDFEDENRILARSDGSVGPTESVELKIAVIPEAPSGQRAGEPGEVTLEVEAASEAAGGSTALLRLPGVEGRRLTGGLALAFDGASGGQPAAWFSLVRLWGAGVAVHPDRRLGPILGAQHLVSRSVLTLTAQLLPVRPIFPGPATASADTVLLEIQDEDGGWASAASAPVTNPGFTATFRIEGWEADREVPYRLTLLGAPVSPDGRPFGGVIRGKPRERDEFVVAAFTGNHNVESPGVDGGSFDWNRGLWFPHEDIVRHVRAHDPDFLFFSGDQVYEGASPTRADFEHPYEDYLYKWYLWFWAFRDLTREIPSVAIPDDHDVFHGNVWGAGGRATPPGLSGAEAQDQGGYKLPADWVNMVQRTQASHLQGPRGPTPGHGEIETYFTDILYGGVSFAVLEDRKFKTPPKLVLPEADVWNGWAQNPAFDARISGDPPGASLLGEAQEAFLEDWATDWRGDTWMKVVLSQTIFQNVATIPADAMSGSVIPSLALPEPGEYVAGDKLAADMDSNGWPPSGRERALRAMRKGFAVHLAGDQHLASTIQYGVDGFGDGPFALCVPSVANFWPRRWYPPEPGRNRAPDAPPYTGDFLDGFGNPMTVFAVSNPARWGREPSALHDRAPGYGIARFHRITREVSLEAWPRWSDPTTGGSPYPGWPVRFAQEDGFGGSRFGFLPTLLVTGLEDPVIQVVSELGGEILYTIRIREPSFSPWVTAPGSYTVQVGEPGTEEEQVFLGLRPEPDPGRTLEVRFGGSGG